MIYTKIYLKRAEARLQIAIYDIPYLTGRTPELQIGSRNDNNQQNTHDFPISSLKDFSS